MKIGTFVPGTFKQLPEETYLSLGAESAPHQVYELRMKTTQMTGDEAMKVAGELMRVKIPGMVVLGVNASGNSVKMQVYSDPFPWAILIGIIPSIIVPLVLLVIGMIIAIRIPQWVWALPFIGIGGGILIYAFMKGKR